MSEAEAAGRRSHWEANRARRAGILLHPTSLPGQYGIGELGQEAHEWLDFLQAAGQRLWQVLPLGPTGYGDSPYQSFSSFAGNPLLISTATLLEEGFLEPGEVAGLEALPADRVDFGAVIPLKGELLSVAARRFLDAGVQSEEFTAFCEAEAAWLEPYVLFSALKQEHGGGVWTAWPEPERKAHEPALAAARERNARSIAEARVLQYWFSRQWRALRRAAAERDILILGDVPIFVAFDSADTWANQQLFDLGTTGEPRSVAGVPPDYFSATGQRWGNPLYLWDRHAEEGYAWWISRMRASLGVFDLVRIDHFRGFESYWSIPATEETAVHGEWLPGPGQALFTALRDALGDRLPVIAEDLGIITPEVEALRDAFGLPGMRILQFAFSGDPRDPYLPHNHVPGCVVYTGTHDNDTTPGWYRSTTDAERDLVRRYLGVGDAEAAWALVRAAYGSVADLAIVPLQDVLGQGSDARMNTPGRAGGNWSYRFSSRQLAGWAAPVLHDLALVFGRL